MNLVSINIWIKNNEMLLWAIGVFFLFLCAGIGFLNMPVETRKGIYPHLQENNDALRNEYISMHKRSLELHQTMFRGLSKMIEDGSICGGGE